MRRSTSCMYAGRDPSTADKPPTQAPLQSPPRRPPPPHNTQNLELIFIAPTARLTRTPVTAAICLRLLQTPSSLINHMAAPTGQKKPVTVPHSISSNAARSSSSSSAFSFIVPGIPFPEMEEEEESSHRSSSRRMVDGEGMVSGV